MRQDGYYYVAQNNKWYIAYWCSGSRRWEIKGCYGLFSDSHFTDINENQILPPEN